jgi:hypothetical protein
MLARKEKRRDAALGLGGCQRDFFFETSTFLIL